MQSIVACVLVLAMASQARWANPGFRMDGFGRYYPMEPVPHGAHFSSHAYTGVPTAGVPSNFRASGKYHAHDEMGQARFGHGYPRWASSSSRGAMRKQTGRNSTFHSKGKGVRVSYTGDHRGFRVLSSDLPTHFAAHVEASAALAAARAASAAPKPVAPATLPIVAEADAVDTEADTVVTKADTVVTEADTVVTEADTVVTEANPVSVVAIVESPVAGVVNSVDVEALSATVDADYIGPVASNSISDVVEPDVVVAKPVASAPESVAVVAEPSVEVVAEPVDAASESAVLAAEPVEDASPAVEVDA